MPEARRRDGLEEWSEPVEGRETPSSMSSSVPAAGQATTGEEDRGCCRNPSSSTSISSSSKAEGEGGGREREAAATDVIKERSGFFSKPSECDGVSRKNKRGSDI
jgi:hypothetical protein